MGIEGATKLKNWNVCFICCWRHWCKNTIEPSKWSNSSRLQKMYLEKDSNRIQVENEIQTVTPAIRISSHTKSKKKSPIVVLRTSLSETKSIMNTCISSKLGMVRDFFNRELRMSPSWGCSMLLFWMIQYRARNACKCHWKLHIFEGRSENWNRMIWIAYHFR